MPITLFPTRLQRQSQKVNSRAIQTSFEQLLKNTQKIAENVPIIAPIGLTEGYYNIVYTKKPSIRGIDLFIIYTGIRRGTGEGPISSRIYYFEEREPTGIKIVSHSSTDDEHQSKGYGSGLILVSNMIIEDAIERYPELFGKRICAEIDDRADSDAIRSDGTRVRRDYWTSFFAEQLGYVRPSRFDDRWYKEYTPHGKER